MIYEQSSQQRQDWRLAIVNSARGLAAGLGLNALSNDVGYRGAAVAVVVFVVAGTAYWVHHLGPRVRVLGDVIAWAAVVGAAAASVVSVTVRADWSGYALIGAVALTMLATLTRDDDPRDTLFGVALVAAGIALGGIGVAVLGHTAAPAGFGITALNGHRGLGGVAMILLGVAVAGIGISVHLLPLRLAADGAAWTGAAAASIGIGLCQLLDGWRLGGASLLVLAAAGAGLGSSLIWEDLTWRRLTGRGLTGRRAEKQAIRQGLRWLALNGAARVLGAVGFFGYGTALALDHQLWIGVPVAGIGVVTGAIAVSFLIDRRGILRNENRLRHRARTVRGISDLAGGATLVATAVAALTNRLFLVTVAAAGCAAAACWQGGDHLGLVTRGQELLAKFEPDTPDPATPGEVDLRAPRQRQRDT